MSVLALAMRTAFSVDWVLARDRAHGPGAEVDAALRRFWARPELTAISPGVDLPGNEWSGIFDRLDRLATRREAMGSGPFWFEVVSRSDELRAEQPVAAVIATLYAVAAWEGAAGEHLYVQPWYAPLREWQHFPLALARNLLAVGAIWSARAIARNGREFLEAAHEAYFDETKRAAISAYRVVENEIELAYGDAVDEMAAALSESCRSGGDNFRPEVAAMLWTLGEVPEAHLLSPHGRADHLPSLWTCQRLVDQSMRRMPYDPFLQYIWLELKDRPPFNIRDHLALFGRVNNFYAELPVHQFDRLLGPEGPSRSYARNLIVHFGGRVAEDIPAPLGDVYAAYGDIIGSSDPASYVRLIALLNLAVDDAGARESNWYGLADTAASILEHAERAAIHKPFDNILDIPFHYLRADSVDGIERSLSSLERYRAAGLWYWLTVVPPALGGAQSDASPLRAEEARLLTELRGARFIRLVPHLPKHYQRYGYSMNERFSDPAPGSSGEESAPGRRAPRRGDPYENPFDQDVARRQLKELQSELRELHAQMAAEDPAYAAARLDPCATLEAFASALPARKRARRSPKSAK